MSKTKKKQMGIERKQQQKKRRESKGATNIVTIGVSRSTFSQRLALASIILDVPTSQVLRNRANGQTN